MQIVRLLVAVGACLVVVSAKEHVGIRRLKNAKLEDVMDALNNGEPVVVADVLAKGNWGMKDWTCDSLRAKYPKEPVQAFGTRTMMQLGSAWEDRSDGLDKQPDDTAFEGSMDSYLWFPIEEGKAKTTALGPEAFAALKTEWGVPYFLPQTPANEVAVHERLEVFLGSRPGAGTKVHIDEICSFIFSSQLSGRKNWFLGPAPTANGSFTEFDEFLRTSKFVPEYETTLVAGETLFFPPGWAHSTAAPPMEPGECSLSSSLQFYDPRPSRYAKNNIHALSHLKESFKCFHWEWNPTIHASADSWTMQGAWRKQLAAKIKQLDANADGVITTEEFIATRKAEVVVEESRNMNSDAQIEAQAKGFLAYHGAGPDGVPTSLFATNYQEWFFEMVDARFNSTDKYHKGDADLEEEDDDDDEPKKNKGSSVGIPELRRVLKTLLRNETKELTGLLKQAKAASEESRSLMRGLTDSFENIFDHIVTALELVGTKLIGLETLWKNSRTKVGTDKPAKRVSKDEL